MASAPLAAALAKRSGRSPGTKRSERNFMKETPFNFTEALSLSKGAYRQGVLRQAQHYGLGISQRFL